MPRFEVNQNLRFVFFGVLLLAFAQVFWWIWDQDRYSSEELARMNALYQADEQVASDLLYLGQKPDQIEQQFPHIEVRSTTATIKQESLAALESRRASRINQYRWEGGFFLLVLLMMMWLLRRTIAAEATLRRRQEDFVAAVSHELKSPLASLQLTAETMERRQGDEESRKRHLKRILTDIERLGTMVSNILDSAKLARGDIESSPENISLHDCIKVELSNLKDRATLRAVRIETEVESDLHVFADPFSVRIVVRNLLENALHATAAAGGGTIQVQAETTDESIVMTVSDNGVGFPPEKRKKIFESFFRVGSEMNRKTPGTGLGLAIVRRYLELDGGYVQANSDGPGTGATFTVHWRRSTARTDIPTQGA